MIRGKTKLASLWQTGASIGTTVDLQIDKTRSDQGGSAVYSDVWLGLFIEEDLLRVNDLAIAHPQVIARDDLSVSDQTTVGELHEFQFRHLGKYARCWCNNWNEGTVLYYLVFKFYFYRFPGLDTARIDSVISYPIAVCNMCQLILFTGGRAHWKLGIALGRLYDESWWF